MMEAELDNVNKLNQEFEVTQETLEKSRSEASHITEQLQHSRHLCSKFVAEASKFQMELEETRTSLQRQRQNVTQSS